MFGNKQKQIAELETQVQKLQEKLKNIETERNKDIQVLRQQLASISVGLAPSTESILRGLPYSEVTKEEVLTFIQKVPNLLILDVRSDQGWQNGYIPNAKHIPADQVFQRIHELADKTRPILTICANGNTAVGICQLLAREGFQNVYNALGGMAGYQGPMVRPEVKALEVTEVKGSDRALVEKVLAVLDRDVRPGLKRDGGDLQVLEIESGIVKLKMVGACVGCGAQQQTVEGGIKTHLQKLVPEIKEVIDLSRDNF